MSQLPVPKEIRRFADFERELQRDPRLKSEHTVRGYRRDLLAFEGWRARRPMTRLLVEEYASKLQAQGKSPSTINRNLAAVRWWARRLGDLAYAVPELNPDRRSEIVTQTARVASIKDVRGQRQQKGRHLYSGELKALLRVCTDDPKPSGIRDAAMIAFAILSLTVFASLFYGGARIQLAAGDYFSLTVIGSIVIFIILLLMTLAFWHGFAFFNRLKINNILLLAMTLRTMDIERLEKDD